MRKINLICIIFVFFIFGLTACKASNPTNGKTPDPAAITAKIIGQGGYVELFNITGDRLPREYTGIDMTLIQSFSVLVCVSNASADEVAVFRMKNSSDVSKITATIEQRIKDREDTFKNYIPAQYQKLKKYTIKTCGPYVLFIVSNNNQKAEKTFDEFFK
jgi:hypothetical protein